MLWKILLTMGLVLAAYLTLKARFDGPDPSSRRTALPPAWGPRRGHAKGVAFAVLLVMALGSGWYLWRSWDHGNQVMQVQVVNAATGVIVLFEARRRDIDGRVVRTLDGREIRLADVERMILTESGKGR
jgi:hypothetical protein